LEVDQAYPRRDRRVGLFVLLAGVIYQFVATKIDAYRWYPPSSEMVDVGGSSMHLHCTGEEGRAPTVVMDIGAGGNLLDWQPVQPGWPNSPACAPTTEAAPVGATQVPNRARASSS
jgi:hypothetical protein